MKTTLNCKKVLKDAFPQTYVTTLRTIITHSADILYTKYPNVKSASKIT
jgi:hypothetical protein